MPNRSTSAERSISRNCSEGGFSPLNVASKLKRSLRYPTAHAGRPMIWVVQNSEGVLHQVHTQGLYFFEVIPSDKVIHRRERRTTAPRGWDWLDRYDFKVRLIRCLRLGQQSQAECEHAAPKHSVRCPSCKIRASRDRWIPFCPRSANRRDPDLHPSSIRSRSVLFPCLFP